MTEVYGGTTSYFYLGNDTMLRFNNQGLLCEWDGENEPRPLRTWCLDEPSSQSPRETIGLGCFFFNPHMYHNAGCTGTGSEGCVPLDSSLYGWQSIPISPIDTPYPTTHQYNPGPVHVGLARPTGVNNGAMYNTQQIVSSSSTGSETNSPASVARRTCSICSRVMRRPSALVTHLNSHKGIKRVYFYCFPVSTLTDTFVIIAFECNVGDCDYASTTKANLERHIRAKHTSTSH